MKYINILKTILKIEKDDFENRFIELQHYIEKSLIDMSYSEINIYYNHYYSSTTFGFKRVNVFPIEFTGEYYDGNDFIAETDLQKMLKSLVSFYICYQLKMCECISEAAENLNRNQITRMALDRIEEQEIEIPKFIKIIREVTDEKEYKNYTKVISIITPAWNPTEYILQTTDRLLELAPVPINTKDSSPV